MRKGRLLPARLRRSNGFTLAEVLLYLTVGGLVVAALLSVTIFHQRDASRHQEMVTSRANLRDGVALLTSELRAAAAGEGDLYSVHRDSFSIRSIHASGVVCGIVPGAATRYTLVLRSGELLAQAEDSVLIYAAGAPGSWNDQWKTLKVVGVDDVGGYVCDWPTGKAAKARIVVTGDTADIRVGSPVRTFRRITYALYPNTGSWWLGRRIGARSIERLIGPFLSPADTGLVFTYLDSSGNPTNVAADVAAVQVFARARRVIRPQGGVRTDSLRTLVWLRGE